MRGADDVGTTSGFSHCQAAARRFIHSDAEPPWSGSPPLSSQALGMTVALILFASFSRRSAGSDHLM